MGRIYLTTAEDIFAPTRIDDMAFEPKKQGFRGSKGFQPFAWA